MKKLQLSTTDKKFTGVLGGVGEYFEVDSTILRVLWVIVTIFTGLVPGAVVYILAWLIMPLPDRSKAAQQDISTTAKSTEETL